MTLKMTKLKRDQRKYQVYAYNCQLPDLANVRRAFTAQRPTKVDSMSHRQRLKLSRLITILMSINYLQFRRRLTVIPTSSAMSPMLISHIVHSPRASKVTMSTTKVNPIGRSRMVCITKCQTRRLSMPQSSLTFQRKTSSRRRRTSSTWTQSHRRP